MPWEKSARNTGEACWGCWRILELQKDTGATGGPQSYRRWMLEVQEDTGATRRRSWGCKERILGLQEKYTGAAGEGHWDTALQSTDNPSHNKPLGTFRA